MASDNDYLDGIAFRTSTDQSNSVDIAHYTNLRLGFNVGRFDKRVEPLYWINPMDNVFNDIAEVKSRPQFEWTDEDNDGVLDLIDLELDTPDGCLTDTKGVTLDSDGDGVVDCLDREPFSPPGFPVDVYGVAQVNDDAVRILTEEDVITIIKNNCDACVNGGIGYAPGTTYIGPDGRVLSSSDSRSNTPGGAGISGSGTTTAGDAGAQGTGGRGTTSGTSGVGNTSGTSGVGTASGGGVGTTINAGGVNTGNTIGRVVYTGCGNWFLPMINFDLDKYGLRPEAYISLHQIASVMKKCPEICVTAHGHTDVRNSNRYNEVLSYKRAKEAVDYLVSAYGIDRNRLNIMYGGEDSPLIANLQANHYTTDIEEQMQFINRRVEFRVCEAADYDMARPEGPDAGVKSLGSSRPGSKYKGNKNSGY